MRILYGLIFFMHPPSVAREEAASPPRRSAARSSGFVRNPDHKLHARFRGDRLRREKSLPCECRNPGASSHCPQCPAPPPAPDIPGCRHQSNRRNSHPIYHLAPYYHPALHYYCHDHFCFQKYCHFLLKKSHSQNASSSLMLAASAQSRSGCHPSAPEEAACVRSFPPPHEGDSLSHRWRVRPGSSRRRKKRTHGCSPFPKKPLRTSIEV